MKPIVTIIVPVYNSEETLKRTIDSILNQTFKDYELLLIDDGSTDKSGEICDDYAKQYDHVRVLHQENAGLSAVRNTGIKEALGEYIAWCDSDDFVSDNYLEELYTLTEKYDTQIAICTKQVVNMDLKNLEDPYIGEDFVLSTQDFFEKMMYAELKGIGVGENGRLYKKTLLTDIQYPVDELFEDSSTSYKIVKKVDKVAISLKPMYYYIRNINSIVQRTFTPKRMEFIKAEEAMTDAVTKQFPQVKEAAERRRVYAYLNTLGHMVRANNKKYRSLEIDLKDKILAYYPMLIKNPRVPKKDKLALRILKYSGLSGYRFAFNVFKKKQMG